MKITVDAIYFFMTCIRFLDNFITDMNLYLNLDLRFLVMTCF